MEVVEVRKAIVGCVLFVIIASLAMWKTDSSSQALVTVENQQQEHSEAIETETKEAFAQSFKYYPIDEKIESRIKGVSWKQGSPVAFEDLCYVEVAYWGFDEKPHTGELIVNKSVAKDIIEIFEELYNARFQIDKIKLIDEYNAEDSESMADNNTSAFCYREVEGKPGQLSKHSYGIAIDINPIQNPYVYKNKVSPVEGSKYVDRSEISKGMILKDDACYEAFTSRGWTWGGDWKYEKDYQHFEKR
jgi:hypothetical protein